MKLFLLPGFLGQKKDFQEFEEAILGLAKAESRKLQTEVFDWFMDAPDLLNFELNEVGAPLWQKLQSKISADEDVVVLGYSLGGRLVLSLREFLKSKNSAVRFVFVSANPGLQDESEKKARQINDRAWAERFRSDDWEQTLKAWNAQAVFQHSKNEPERLVQDFDRDRLAKVLTHWSLASQRDYRSSLKTPRNYLWITGELDRKFTDLAKNSVPEPKVISDAGHRLHLDAPRDIARDTFQFLFRA